MLFPTGGVEKVEKYMSEFSTFYRAQIRADNHAVREAACACIAELASKCSEQALDGHWEELLKSLIDCFGDDSWPVRDATAIAAGNFVRSLPQTTQVNPWLVAFITAPHALYSTDFLVRIFSS